MLTTPPSGYVAGEAQKVKFGDRPAVSCPPHEQADAARNVRSFELVLDLSPLSSHSQSLTFLTYGGVSVVDCKEQCR